jgi:hypothetical protein
MLNFILGFHYMDIHGWHWCMTMLYTTLMRYLFREGFPE